uniref:PPM-type phosphatase domain-containing protein n=1 Tax=Fibrocapsa japonica TaxID=94617 RepID=A0A7S2UZU0_9STRA
MSNANKADTSNAPFSSITDQPAKDSSSQVQEDRLPPIASTEEAATTDGGGGENTSPSTTVGGLVVAVLDGHGSDLGREASHRAAEGMAAWLDQHFATRLAPEGADVVMAMRDLFQHTHAHLFEAYKMLLRARGFEVEEQHGYLVRRRIAGNNAPPTSSRSRLMRRQRSGGLDASKRGKLEQAGWECVHGGTSASVVAFLNQGRTMIVANVGDSAGLLAVEGLHLGDYTHLRKPLTPSLEAQGFPALGAGEVVIDVGDQVAEEEVEARERRCMVLTADHSPESLAEFDRMRRTHPNPKTKHWPFLQLVYDEPGKRKVECPRVFDFDNRGKLGVTNNGRYYKNVRQEWASLVTTPSTARFHDALAFTRSLGDFHLHANGLSCLPEVFEVDLQAIRNLKKSGSNSSSGGGGSVLGVLALASDGVWDNWDWDEVADYVLQPDHLRCLRDQGPDTSAQRFKQANTDRARANFGGDSDNASGVMCYISL